MTEEEKTMRVMRQDQTEEVKTKTTIVMEQDQRN